MIRKISSYEVPPPRVGKGYAPQVTERFQKSYHGVNVTVATADISRATDWSIRGQRDTVIVHLSGRMTLLETELDGHGGSSGPANPGEIWTVPAGYTYHSHAQGQSIAYAEFEFDLQNSPAKTRELRGIAGEPDAILYQTSLKIARLIRMSDDVAALEAESLVEIIRDRVNIHLTSTSTSMSARSFVPFSQQQSRLVREFILDHLANRISLSDLCQVTNYSTHHLLMAFRQSFGTTPAQYILTQRLRVAQSFLLHTSLDITDIALRTGFSSHSHLTTAFRQRQGMLPSELRKMQVRPPL